LLSYFHVFWHSFIMFIMIIGHLNF
jgi:hypothetical protein